MQTSDDIGEGIEPRCQECDNRHDPDLECPHRDIDNEAEEAW